VRHTQRGRVRQAFAIAPIAAILAIGYPIVAGAASGSVTVGPTSLSGSGQVNPGESISAGYDVAFGGGQPATRVQVSGATATIELSCKQNQPPAGQLVIQLSSSTYDLAAGDSGWHATASPQDAAGYQGAGAAPDLCAGKKMWVDTHSSGGVTYSATLSSWDTQDAIQIRFHAVDAGAANCGNAAQNTAACNAAWTSPASTNAASLPGAPSNPGTGNTGPGTGNTGPGTGNPGPGAGNPGTGTGGTNPGTTNPGPGAGNPGPVTDNPGTSTVAGSPAGSSNNAPIAPAVSAAVSAAVATHAAAEAASGSATNQPAAPAASAASAQSAPHVGRTDFPLKVIVALAGGGAHHAVSPIPGLASTGSLLSELPIHWLAAVAALDVVLAVAVVVRRRRAHQQAATS